MRCLWVLAFAATLGASTLRAAPVDEAAGIPPTPETISISDEGAKGFAVVHFPTRLHLYTYDKDSPGVSSCSGGCAAAWPPIRAVEGARPVGDWTLVERTDGPPQWAYKGKPVYVRYHDKPDAPGGDGIDGVWHLIANIPNDRASAPSSSLPKR